MSDHYRKAKALLKEAGATEGRHTRHGVLWTFSWGDNILVSDRDSGDPRAFKAFETDLRRRVRAHKASQEQTVLLPSQASPPPWIKEDEPVSEAQWEAIVTTTNEIEAQLEAPAPQPVPEETQAPMATESLSITLKMPVKSNHIPLDRLLVGQMAKDARLEDCLIYFREKNGRYITMDTTSGAMAQLTAAEVKAAVCEVLPAGVEITVRSNA